MDRKCTTYFKYQKDFYGLFLTFGRKQMELQSFRLLLKEIGWSDLENIYQLSRIPEVDEYNTMGIPESVEDTKEMLRPIIDVNAGESKKSHHWTINRKSDGEFIGEAGLFLSCDKYRSGEIYYKLDPAYWGNGFATEVAKLLIKTGFEHFRLHRIEAGVATQNTKSIAVLEKTAMTREGLRRKILPIRGSWYDNYHYAILEDDPRDY